MEREFKRRGVFLELRLENAIRIQNGATGVYKVSIERTKELLADAQVMQDRTLVLPRGTPLAYAALARNIGVTLKQEARRGLWDDPGMDEMKKRAAQSPACFDVGDEVLYFPEDSEYGEKAIVTAGYAMHAMLSEEGHYITDTGVRIEYQHGYVIKCDGSDRFFCSAHRLTRDDCKPAYLQMVSSNTAAHSALARATAA